MLGLSYGEILLILGATAALIGPKDLPKIARTAGRLVGRAIGYGQLARGQLDNVMQNTQLRQVNKELQDAMTQLDAIRHEIRGISLVNPGPFTRRLDDIISNQTNTDNGAASDAVRPTTDQVLNTAADSSPPSPPQHKQSEPLPAQQTSFIPASNMYEDRGSMPKVPSVSSDLHSQATVYSRLAESPAVKAGSTEPNLDIPLANDDKPGLLAVLPVSAESAGLLPNRQGEMTGSDIVLEAVLEAEVARNAKGFFSQPQNQIKTE